MTDYFQRDPEVLALLLGSSIAHGFESQAAENIEALYKAVKGFRPWIEDGFSWPTQFKFDSELRVDDKTPVDDL